MIPQNIDNQSSVPGQVTLPGFEGEMGYEVINLKPWEERFCVEYVQRARNGKAAYMAVKPNVSERTAEVESSKLLRKPEICARLKQRIADFNDRLIGLVENYHRNVMEVDRASYLDDKGTVKSLNEMSPEARSILELEQVSTKNGVRTLLKVPTRHQSAVEIAKITGLHKTVELPTGATGNVVVSITL